tara:strand:- start:446 stop:778 length:333 start_codon:yes stop_codon:yes gene_type:complete
MSFFSHEQVQQNLQDIFSQYQEIAIQTGRLGFMSKSQKIEHIGECEQLIEKQKVFYTRLCLAAQTDEEAADMKTRINAMCEAFGFADLSQCMESMIKTLGDAKINELDRP